MAQPLLSQIFADNAIVDEVALTLTIDLNQLSFVGLDNIVADRPLSIFVAILLYANIYLSANLDESILMTSSISSSSPVTRNNAETTAYSFLIEAFGPYISPILDPDQI